MKKLFFSMMGLVFALGLLACEADKMYSDTGNMAAATEDVSVNVDTAALAASDICGGITVTIYSSLTNYTNAVAPDTDAGTGKDVGFPYTCTVSAATDNAWVCNFTDIPEGDGRYFVANAYGDTSDNGVTDCDDVIFTGVQTADIEAGMDSVDITLTETTDHPVVENTAPLLDSLNIEKKYVAVGDTVCMTAVGVDPDPRGDLIFTWALDDDAVTGEPPVTVSSETPLSETVCWTPTTKGTYDLEISVSDGLLSTAFSSPGAIEVYDVIDFGVELEINESPVIVSVVAQYGLVPVGSSFTITANATDTDLDVDGYVWSVNSTTCVGLWGADTTGNIVTYTVDSSVAAGVECEFSVVVHDLAGNDSSASTSIFVGPPGFTPTYDDPQTVTP